MIPFPATKCDDCDMVYGHPPAICRECNSENIEEYPIDGSGTVYARTTIRVPSEKFQNEVPYEVYLVDVGDEESVRVTARLNRLAGLEPGDDVRFVERRDQTFYFEKDD